MAKNIEFSEMTLQELEARAAELLQEGFNFRVQQKSNQLEKKSLIRSVRRTLARVKTELTKKRNIKEGNMIS